MNVALGTIAIQWDASVITMDELVEFIHKLYGVSVIKAETWDVVEVDGDAEFFSDEQAMALITKAGG